MGKHNRRYKASWSCSDSKLCLIFLGRFYIQREAMASAEWSEDNLLLSFVCLMDCCSSYLFQMEIRSSFCSSDRHAVILKGGGRSFINIVIKQ